MCVHAHVAQQTAFCLGHLLFLKPHQEKGANTLTGGITPQQGIACYNNTLCHLAAVSAAVSGEQQGCTFTDANLSPVLFPPVPLSHPF